MARNQAAIFSAPDDYAIIVGINRYRSEDGIEPLNGAVNDAVLFRDWIVDPEGGGLDPAHVALFTSTEDGPLAPNRDVIEDQILQTFYQKMFDGVRPVGRRLYLFMAGHGVAPVDGDDCSLIAANSFISSLRVLTGKLTADRILKQPMFQEVVLFMACCRDVGANANPFSGLPPAGEPLNDRSAYLYGFAVKWAKKALEKQLEHPLDRTKPPLWQSVFSYALIKGLNSAFDDEGRVTSLSLKGVVKEQVMRLLPAGNNTPPQFLLDEDMPLIVFKSRAADSSRARCRTRRATARSGRPAPRGSWTRVGSRVGERATAAAGRFPSRSRAGAIRRHRRAAGWSDPGQHHPVRRCHGLRNARRRNACGAQPSRGDRRGRDVQGVSQAEPLCVPRPGPGSEAGIRAGGGHQCRTLKRS
jgi:hypothetical protein